MTGIVPTHSARSRRLLILGPVNTPHTEHLALGARERGFNVTVGGGTWDTLPPSDLPEHGIEVSVATWPTARWLQNLLARVEPDLVHANWLGSAFLYLLYGATPMVAMAWGSDVYLAGWRGRLQNRLIVRCAGMVMADSVDLLRALRALGARSDRSFLLNWGVDLRMFSPAPAGEVGASRASLGLPEGRLILSPRSIRPVYNPRTIVDAFELIAERHPDVQLVFKHIHGDDPDLGPLRHPDRVHTVGHVAYERMADYYRSADVCISVPSSDSSPRSVWEAMACGVPCILSDLPWAHELVRDDRDALIVAQDPPSVAGALDRLLSDPELARTIGSNGRALVEHHRDREAELDRLTEIYERIAVERPGTSMPIRLLQRMAAAGGTALSLARHRAMGPVRR